MSRTLTKTVVGSFFNGGIRAYSIEDPTHPVEIGYLVEAARRATRPTRSRSTMSMSMRTA